MIVARSRYLTRLLLVSAALAASPGIVQPHEIEITADEAAAKVRHEVVATVRRGERYRALRVQLPWVAIELKGEAAGKVGWVPVDKVRPIVGPSFDETVPAPDAPSAFHVQADLTQVNGSAIQVVMPGGQVITTHFRGPSRGGLDAKKIPASYLAFRLTLRNDSSESLAVAPGDFKLRADDQEIASLPADDVAGMLAAEGAIDFRGDPSELSPFPAGPLAPGETKQGWLCFDLSTLPLGKDRVRMPTAERWSLRAAWADLSLELDLKANEVNALNARARPSQLDSTVQVVEIGNRLNALNLEKLLVTLESLKSESAVVFLEAVDCQHDQAAQAFFQSLQYGSSAQPDGQRRLPKLWQVRDNQAAHARSRRYRNGFSPPYFAFGPAATSEPLATIQVLSERPQAGSQLVKHLSHESLEIRAASARALAPHLAEQGVIAALASAVKDSVPTVRAASLHALATAPYSFDRYGRPILNPTPTAQSQNPEALAAVLTAFHDTEAIVRNAAATAAKAFPSDQIASDLISLLDDKDLSVQIAACQSLGQLGTQAAVARLKELSTKTNDGPADAEAVRRGPSDAAALRTAALDALVALDAMPDVDAAIAKLERGNPSSQDFQILSEAQDERAVPLLIERMRANFPNLDHQVIQTLGDSGDARAVEPLIEALNLVHVGGDDVVVQALGHLRDRRAIEPLRRRMAKQEQPHARVAYLAALLLVDDPQAFAEVQSLVKAPDKLDPFRGGQLIEALGRSGHVKAPDLIEPYLDDARYCQSAAKAMAFSRLPKAYTALANRLESAKYAYGMMVVSALAQDRAWALSPHGQATLKDAAQSRNPATRSSAEATLRSLQTQIRQGN